MGEYVNLMEEALLKSTDEGELILKEDHRMNIFKPIRDRVTPVPNYDV